MPQEDANGAMVDAAFKGAPTIRVRHKNKVHGVAREALMQGIRSGSVDQFGDLLVPHEDVIKAQEG